MEENKLNAPIDMLIKKILVLGFDVNVHSVYFKCDYPPANT
jgi:hypothetical protein